MGCDFADYEAIDLIEVIVYEIPKLSNKDWFGWAVIVCIGVTLFVLLSNISSVIAVLARIIGYFRPVILGIIIAYIVSPLTKLFFYRVLRRMRHRQLRWYLSVFLSFALILQSVDAYILKPRLFSSALGVSGVAILISTIVLGNMFGILGVLMAIPVAAILSFAYQEYFMKSK